jgi:3-hydroxyisobutyrate dehydrogenase-like beta-hydroxyacid dehydrogenase
MAKIGFVGLGVMGGPMAGHLVKAGHQVFVWNRTPSKAAPLAELGATVCDNLSELAPNCDIICTCVGTSQDVEAVTLELAKSANPNTLFIDHSTIEPSMAKSLAERLANNNLRFVDAPITGGSMGAQAGTLTIFCGGNEADVAQAIDAIQPYAKRAERVGEVGAGQTMKLANQIAVGGALIGLCESLGFAAKAGLNLEQAHSMIGGGAGGSWAFVNYGPKVLNSDWSPGFSIKNQTKDFRYCEAAAEEFGVQIPMTELVHKLLNELKNAGREEETTAALFELYKQSK